MSDQNPSQFHQPVLLKNGTPLLLRAMRPTDKAALLDFFYRLSPRSVYFRFFQTKTRLTDEELAYFTELDFVNRVALVGVMQGGEPPAEQIVAVGRYSITEPGKKPLRAEVAFAVEDRLQGQGLGTLLLEHLLPLARRRGVEEFEADVLGENNRMLQLFGTFGLTLKRTLASGVIHLTFPTTETDHHTQLSLGREAQAAVSSLRRLLRPQNVAVIGASNQPASIGRTLMENLLQGGFTGKVWPVNPREEKVLGLPAFAAVGRIPAEVDLAVVAVPAPLVQDVVRACVAKKIPGAVIISAGFGETGEEGRTREKHLASLAARGGLRLIGPNCLGLVNTDPAVKLNATFTDLHPPRGGVGFLSQSGGLGLALMGLARGMGLGVSTFVSVGNGADVGPEDLLAWWAEDEHTRVAALYLEHFPQPRRFARLAAHVSRRKPVVAVKAGRSPAGQRAAQSHSAALAASNVAVDALFAEVGVVRVDTLQELLQRTAFFSTQPLPGGRGVAVVTNAGGPAILLADALQAGGLELPALSTHTTQALSALLPAAASLRNPVDMIASATPEQMTQALQLVGQDEAVHSVVAIYIAPRRDQETAVARAIAQGAGLVPADKPFQCVFISADPPPPELLCGPRGNFPVFPFPEDAARTLADAVAHAAWREKPQGKTLPLKRLARDTVKGTLARLTEGAKEPFWTTPADFHLLMKAVGITVAYGETAPPHPDKAAQVAERLGYPLVAKVLAPGVLHKTEVGGVVMGLNNAQAVARTVTDFQARLKEKGLGLEGVYLQRQVSGGVEAFVGVTQDALFGPLMMVGVGGVQVELLRDVAFGLPPLTDIKAADMLGRLRSLPLLRGFRGSAPRDEPALVQLLLRLSALLEIAPQIVELDLNPVSVLDAGQGAIVLDGRLKLAPG